MGFLIKKNKVLIVKSPKEIFTELMDLLLVLNIRNVDFNIFYQIIAFKGIID